MKFPYALIFCLVGLVAASPVMAAKVYKWVDKDGVTNFSEHPPRNTQSEELKPKTGHSEPVKYDTTGRVETPPPAEDADATPQPIKDPERCEIARKNFQTLQNFGRVRVRNDDGSFHYLTEVEQLERLKDTQKSIDENCE